TLHDYSIVAGRLIHFPVGGSAAYRLFVPEDGGARRSYCFHMSDDHEPRSELLERELAASTVYWKDDPRVCEMKHEAGLKAELPERVDPAEDPRPRANSGAHDA